MMKTLFLLALGISASNSVFAMVLENHSLILTHTSKHYHTHPETIIETRKLMNTVSGNVIALSQVPIQQDPLWYALPLSSIDHEIYSHAGENELRFPQGLEIKEFHITLAGGYLSACLGRTLSYLLARFIQGPHSIESLTVHLPRKSIFTGFILNKNVLVPQTPYLESILDSSMDGLNLDQVLNTLAPEEQGFFLDQILYYALKDKKPLMGIDYRRSKINLLFE